MEKSNGTLYWYGGGSDVLYETDLSGGNGRDYIFFGGRRLARYDETAQTIYHYFEDHLGSSRVIVQSTTNTPCYDGDFGPYGQEQTFTNTCAQNYKFTGKERATETGNDDFGARFYENNLGRFMSIDPSGLSALSANPQSWNRYSFTLNNPLKFVDQNGKWPTEIHNQIIEKAFPGLSVQQRNQLKQTSAWVDRLAGQTKAHNHEHAMKSPGEDPAAAKVAIERNIQNHEQAAQRAQGGTPDHVDQVGVAALKEFGQALHTVEDRTSPAHTDDNGNPRDWNGIPNPLSPSEVEAAGEHNQQEANITDDEMNNSVNEARDAFRQTFGDKAAQEAQTDPHSDPKKEKD